jgi:hypothetical protein
MSNDRDVEAATQKPQIKISEVQKMLKDGKTRSDIGVRYGINGTDVKALFQHPELKGRKTIVKKESSFVIIDDVTVQADNAIQDTSHDAEDDVAEVVQESPVMTEESPKTNSWTRK